MNKQYITVPMSLFWLRVMFAAIAFFMIYPSAGLLENHWGKWFFSGFALFLYLPAAYREGWALAERDCKSSAQTKGYLLKGLVVGILSELPGLMLLDGLLFAHFFRTHYFAANIAYLIYNLPFLALFGPPVDQLLTLNYVPMGFYLCLLVVPLFTSLGYIAGMHKFSFGEKLFAAHITRDEK